jgi:hypothetical protein
MDVPIADIGGTAGTLKPQTSGVIRRQGARFTNGKSWIQRLQTTGEAALPLLFIQKLLCFERFPCLSRL